MFGSGRRGAPPPCTPHRHRRSAADGRNPAPQGGPPAEGAGEDAEPEPEPAGPQPVHVVVPVSVAESRPTVALLWSLLCGSKEWRRMATEEAEELLDMNQAAEVAEEERPAADAGDSDDGEGEAAAAPGGEPLRVPRVPSALQGISMALVDTDGTTSLLRCYDTVEPPEPEANRVAVE